MLQRELPMRLARRYLVERRQRDRGIELAFIELWSPTSLLRAIRGWTLRSRIGTRERLASVACRLPVSRRIDGLVVADHSIDGETPLEHGRTARGRVGPVWPRPPRLDRGNPRHSR